MSDNAAIEAIRHHMRTGATFASRDLSTGEIHELVITEFPVQCSGRPSELRIGARVRRRHGDGPIFWVPIEDLIVRTLPKQAEEQLPIIEELERATTFTEIATWLTRCPLAIFASHGHDILAVVKARGFGKACTYVNEYVATVHRARNGLFQSYYGGVQFDGNGTASEDLRKRAEALDSAVTAVGRIDLAWHQINQPSEVTDAG